MSEFYTRQDFLEKSNYASQYNALIAVLTQQSSNIRSAANRLRYYSGFGIEDQVRALDKRYSELMKYSENIRKEYNSLSRIIDTVNMYDRKAKNIMDGVTENFDMAGYTYSETSPYVISSENRSFLMDILDWIKEFFDPITEDMDIVDYFDFLFNSISVIAKTNDSEITNYISFIKLFDEIFSFYADGGCSQEDWLVDSLNISKDTVKAYKSIYKILEKAKLIPKAADNPSFWGNLAEYSSVIGVIFSTGASAVEDYNKFTEDGHLSFAEGNEMVLDASIDGLSTCIAALIGLIPVVGPVGGYIYKLADDKYNFTENAKNGIKDWADGQAADIYNTIYSDEKIAEFYDNSSDFTQVVTRTILLSPWLRKIIKTGKFSII